MAAATWAAATEVSSSGSTRRIASQAGGGKRRSTGRRARRRNPPSRSASNKIQKTVIRTTARLTGWVSAANQLATARRARLGLVMRSLPRRAELQSLERRIAELEQPVARVVEIDRDPEGCADDQR